MQAPENIATAQEQARPHGLATWGVEQGLTQCTHSHVMLCCTLLTEARTLLERRVAFHNARDEPS